MAAVTKRYMISIYRLFILFLGFLFIHLSGCRSRQVDHQTDHLITRDTSATDNDLMPAPEYGVKPVNWEEIPEEIVKDKQDEYKDVVTSDPEDKKKLEEKTPVTQPSPEPLEPATAYGTNIHKYSPVIHPGQ